MTESPELILIVDDTPDNLAVLGEVLRDHYRVKAANSGRRALQIAAEHPQPDLILLDVMMPELDGYAVLSELRANPSTSCIPVIFVTAMDSTEDEEHGLSLGAVDYITKPIRPAIVQARVRTQLELKRTRDWLTDQNGYLEAEVARRMRENLLIQEISIRALANLAEIRDWETGNHIRRTQAYVRALANHLKDHPRFTCLRVPQMVESIARAAPLHDVGKVGIPDEILRKRSQLTASEFEIMKTHTTLGRDAIEAAMRGALSDPEYEALKLHCRLGHDALAEAMKHESLRPLAFLEMAKDIALRHHERWDGSGYPDGLVGEAIPIPARLMALADVYDALSFRRVYKDAINPDVVYQIIAQGRGSHFDPDVVDAFQDIRDQFEAIARRHQDD